MMKMVIVNKYDEVLCELKWDDSSMYYKVPAEYMDIFKYLDEGDTFTVKSIWTEE